MDQPVEDNYHHPDQRWKREGLSKKKKALAVIEARTKGRLFKDIAEELGIVEHYARALYTKYISKQIVEKVEHVRKLEGQRLDYMFSEAYKILEIEHLLVQQGRVVMSPMLQDGHEVFDEEGKRVMVCMKDHSAKLAALATMLKISERKSKLWGLDAPTKVAATNPDGTQEAQQFLFYLPSNGRDESETMNVISEPI